MTTALQIIEAAMGKINVLAVGETVSAEDADLCLDRLNTLRDSLLLEPTFQYKNTETSFTLPAATTSRTIGASQQINVARPVKIEIGSFTRIDSIDYPLEPVSQAEYNDISQKSLAGYAPEVCFFDGGSPTGNVYFWPPTTASVEVHLVTMTAVTPFADLDTDYDLPPGYRRYFEYGLAVEIAPDFRVAVNPMIAGAASNAKRAIMRMNRKVPQLKLDCDGSQYNIYSGY